MFLQGAIFCLQTLYLIAQLLSLSLKDCAPFLSTHSPLEHCCGETLIMAKLCQTCCPSSPVSCFLPMVNVKCFRRNEQNRQSLKDPLPVIHSQLLTTGCWGHSEHGVISLAIPVNSPN